MIQRLAVAALAVGLSAGFLVSAPVQAAPTAPTPTTQIATPRGDARGGGGDGDAIKWGKCASADDQKAGMQCARFVVPWDWSRPKGLKYSLALKRLPALPNGTPNRSKPSLFINPGGPGGSGTESVDAFTRETQLRRKYYIVGWDPRGVPTSTPGIKACPDKNPDLPATGPFTWPSIANAYATSSIRPICVQRNRNQLRSIGTNNVVRDLDAMRSAVGDSRLSYFGYSYGTTIGRIYAMRYPTRINAMVLDGVVMPGNSMDGYTTSSTKASNAAWDYLRGLVPDPINELADQVTNYLQTHTVEVGGRTTGRWHWWRLSLQAAGTASPVGVYTQLVCSTASEANLPTTPCVTSQTRRSAGVEAIRVIEASAEEEEAPITAAVRCTDYKDRPASSAASNAFLAAGGRPETAGNIFLRSLMCTGWPTRNVVPGLTNPLRTSTPILLVNGIADQATGYWGAQQTASNLVGHRFITVNTGIHGLFRMRASACIRNPVIRYLLTRQLPSANVTCQKALA